MTYPFMCKSCGKHFELSLTISQYSSLTNLRCPKCESDMVVREFTHTVIKYVGTGFYTTDHGKINNEPIEGAS